MIYFVFIHSIGLNTKANKKSHNKKYIVLQVCLAHVTRQEKKKRDWVLCLARTNDVPVYVKIYLLKKTDKDSFKKKQEWQLRDLKVLDGVSAESQEIKMDLDERYSWIVASVQEKEAFLKIVQNLCERYNIGEILFRTCEKYYIGDLLFRPCVMCNIGDLLF